MRLSTVASIVGLSLVSVFAAGCTAEATSSEDSAIDSSEDALKSNLLGDVAAVQLNPTVTVAQSRKVSRVLSATKLSSRSKKPVKGALRCPADGELKFLDAKGAVIATAGLCTNLTEPARSAATLTKGADTYILDVDVNVLATIAGEPLVVADVTYGVTKVVVKENGPGGDATTIGRKEEVDLLVSALGPNQTPDPRRPMPRCLPSHIVSYYRGNDAVATTSFLCGAGNTDPGIVASSFMATVPNGPRGAIDIDASVILATAKEWREAQANDCPQLAQPRFICPSGKTMSAKYDDEFLCVRGWECR